MCIHMQRDHIHTLEIIQSTSECSGFWEHKRNQHALKVLKLDLIQKKEHTETILCWHPHGLLPEQYDCTSTPLAWLLKRVMFFWTIASSSVTLHFRFLVRRM